MGVLKPKEFQSREKKKKKQKDKETKTKKKKTRGLREGRKISTEIFLQRERE